MNTLEVCFPGPDKFYLADPNNTTVKENGGIRWAVDREFNIPLEKAIQGHEDGTLKKGVVLPPLVWNEDKKIYESIWGAIDIDGNIYTGEPTIDSNGIIVDDNNNKLLVKEKFIKMINLKKKF